jgi:queuine/archaeosine tRNA-ribosyltransferase
MASVLTVAGRALPLPAFFPSVSSVKTNGRPVDYVEILVALGEPQFLVSAYDIAHALPGERERFAVALARASECGATVLLDSGNYEAYWLRDPGWSPADLSSVLRSVPAPLAFSFDNQDPAADIAAAAIALVADLDRDQKATPQATVLPIVHGSADTLPERVRTVAERIQPLLLAVPERALGDGLVSRITCAGSLRRVLDQVAPSCVLHLLGTGNPLALAAYALAGAQTFDGLEWCQTCVDPDTAWLHHFHHRDLVTPVEPELTRELPYAQGTLVHNLLFLRSWMRRLRESLELGAAIEMLAAYLPPARRTEIVSAIERRRW